MFWLRQVSDENCLFSFEPLLKLILLISILCAVALVALLVVIALYRHKKRATGDVLLVGQLGQVHSALDPEGTVIIQGEMWPACCGDDEHIPAETKVRIVDTRGHLLIATREVCR
jgi:membrane-bound ClpP family serine protease